MKTHVIVNTLPTCDLCGQPAHYDAKSIHGPWGNFCEQHFRSHTWGRLGLGWGQRLVLSKDIPHDNHQ